MWFRLEKNPQLPPTPTTLTVDPKSLDFPFAAGATEFTKPVKLTSSKDQQVTPTVTQEAGNVFSLVSPVPLNLTANQPVEVVVKFVRSGDAQASGTLHFKGATDADVVDVKLTAHLVPT